jgi:hypothetical protein
LIPFRQLTAALRNRALDRSLDVVAQTPDRVLTKRLRRSKEMHLWYRSELRSGQFGYLQPEDTTPPDDERIDIPVVWAIELYTPLHARSLTRGLQRLGLGKRRPWHETDVVGLVESHRGSVGQSFTSLGILRSKSAQHISNPDSVPADLPHGVDAIFLWAHQLTPSITALAAECVLSDDERAAFDNCSRRTDFKPHVTRRRGGTTFLPPQDVKQKAMREQRTATRDLAARWVAAHIPGAFCEIDADQIPTVEVILTDLAEPFSESDERDYLDFADLRWDPFVFVSTDLDGWKLSLDRLWFDRPVATLAGKRSDALSDATLKGYGSSGWYLAQRMNEATLGDFTAWAGWQLLVQMQRRLARVRDDVAATSSSRRATRRISRIREEFLRDSLDSRTAAAELRPYGNRRGRRLGEPISASWHGVGKFHDRTLDGDIRANLRVRTRVLAESEERLRDALIADTNLISAIANLRTQFRVGVAAIVVAVLVSVHPNFHHLWQHLRNVRIHP